MKSKSYFLNCVHISRFLRLCLKNGKKENIENKLLRLLSVVDIYIFYEIIYILMVPFRVYTYIKQQKKKKRKKKGKIKKKIIFMRSRFERTNKAIFQAYNMLVKSQAELRGKKKCKPNFNMAAVLDRLKTAMLKKGIFILKKKRDLAAQYTFEANIKHYR